MQKDSDSLAIVLTSDAVAPFVWLEAEGFKGHFSTNGFLFGEDPRSTITVHFLPSGGVPDPKAFQEALTVRSLMDVYK